MITGSIVALVTPMTLNGEIDWSALTELVEWHIAEGTDSIVAVGTTGESATLDMEEHARVIKAVVDQVSGRIPVIAGTGANCTKEAIALTKSAKMLGADACLLVTPYYNKPTQEGLFHHYIAIADRVAIPQILYNVPGRTACDLLPETVLRLAGHPNIVGIKEATGELGRAEFLLKNCPKNFAIYSGDDPTAVELMLKGGKGNISVTANIVPKLMAELCRLAMAGQTEVARELNQRLMPLHKNLFVESNPIPVKWALHLMGKIKTDIRLPLVPLTAEGQAVLKPVLAAAGLIS